MYPREFPISPSQQATNGALDIFVEGCRTNNVRQQLFGLSVLHSATEAQVEASMHVVQTNQSVTRAEIDAWLAR